MLLVFVKPERGKGVHRRIDVAEVPFVGGDLAAGVEVQAAQHQQKLLLGEIEVHQRQRDRVECQIPGRVPRILPLVRHGDHVGVQHVEPFRVPHVVPSGPEKGMALVLAQPLFQIEVVVLLAPQHSRQRLAMHPALIFGQRIGRDPLVEFISVGDAAIEDLLEAGEGVLFLAAAKRSRTVLLPPPGTSRI